MSSLNRSEITSNLCSGAELLVDGLINVYASKGYLLQFTYIYTFHSIQISQLRFCKLLLSFLPTTISNVS